MLQEWADMVDAWIDERTHVPKLLQENMVVHAHVGGVHGWRSYFQAAVEVILLGSEFSR